MKELWLEIYQTIRRSKWRSIMTAFGIFWGMLMLVILVGIGFGFNNGIVSTLKTLPTNSIFFFSRTTSMAYKGFAKGRYWHLENSDMDIIQKRFGKRIERLVPMNQAGSYRCSFEDRSDEYSVVGTTDGYYYSVPQKLVYGRYLNEIDQKERRKVCVIGERIYNNLYKRSGNPCGQLIKVGDIYYTVVGVVKETSGMINFGAGVNESVHVPLTTAQSTYGQGDAIHIIITTLKDEYPASKWQDQMEAVIREMHYIHPDDAQAIRGFNLAELIEKFDLLFLGIYILIWIIGAGTLLAGLIGVSNIMLVTVKERTQEIGIRRAIGASPFSILSQVVLEGLAITLAAGLAGLTLGVWWLQAVDILSKGAMTVEHSGDTSFSAFDNPQIPFSVAVASFIILLVGGLIAGWMPAKRAMEIKAIDALRDE